jgi:thiamine-monophosphate kinase
MREFDLLQHVYAANSALGAEVVIPPGDDMGGIRWGNRLLLATVDQVADGVHVQVEGTPLDLIARKAIVRNLSDVAAMAAVPLGAVAAVSLPRDFGEDRARQLADALRHHADRYHCPLFGGDVSMWDHPLLITVTVFAEPGSTARSCAAARDRATTSTSPVNSAGPGMSRGAGRTSMPNPASIWRVAWPNR